MTQETIRNSLGMLCLTIGYRNILFSGWIRVC